MIWFRAGCLVGLLVWASSGPAWTAEPGPSSETLESWPWFQELDLAERGPGRYGDFLVTPSVFDQARTDLGDLRLRDGRDREIPYALRARRTEDIRQPLAAKEFNRTTNPDRSVEVSLDLGTGSIQHNEIAIATEGQNFRRRARVEGSEEGKNWSPLIGAIELLHFQTEEQRLDVRRFSYPGSRRRYVRVVVFPDLGVEKDAPRITAATVYQTVREPGLYVTLPASLGARQDVRTEGNPGSAWLIEFGGMTVPVEQLRFEVADEDFVRSYRLEQADPGEQSRILTSGDWRRRVGGERKQLEIHFPEVMVRRLRLVVTDYRNQPLSLRSVQYTAPARQVIFAGSADLSEPVRLYYGNPKAGAPHYDFAANLPAVLEPVPVRVRLKDVPLINPSYRPAPKPWTEQWPWLVYVVLGAASLILLGILVVLGRQAIRQHDAAEVNPTS